MSRVSVLPREEVSIKAPPDVEPFEDWNGVNFASKVDFGWADGQGEDPRAYVIRLHLQIKNETGRLTPYNVDVEAIGYFDLLGDVPLADREDIGKVNGASLLYGVLREVVLSLTIRSPWGPLVLPSVNFIDLRAPAHPKTERVEATATPQ